jgi:hypothetical protein
MGWAYAGETGILSGLAWAMLVNYQEAKPWFRRPWLHLVGATVGYVSLKWAASWEDEALQRIINQVASGMRSAPLPLAAVLMPLVLLVIDEPT